MAPSLTQCLSLLALLVLVVESEAKRGLIMTAPGTWLTEKEEKICVSFHDIDFDVATSTSITRGVNSRVQTKKVTFNKGTDGCFSMKIDEANVNDDLELEFSAQGSQSNYSFSDTVPISVKSGSEIKANITFIELDKPIYKPGNEVKFRVMTIQEQLKPRIETIPLVYMTDPAGVRMMQWRNVHVEGTQGLAQFSMQLSADPPKGEWKVKVELEDGKKQERTFLVQEYVLPKFDVQLKPPVYVPVNADSVEAQACAHYTYGEPVKGNLTVRLCMKTQYYYYDRREYTCQSISEQINGCHKFKIPVQELLVPSHTTGHGNQDFYGLFIRIEANVEEEGTSISMNTSVDTPSLGFDLFKIEFKDMSKYFKPGLPYLGKVKVTKPDGTPAADQEVKVSKGQQGSTSQEVETVVTDNKGIARFTWTNLKLADKADNVMAKAHISLEESQVGAYERVMHEPSASFMIKVWFSPSESYMAIDRISENVDCGSQFSAHFVFNQGHNHEFSYRILAQNSIVLEGELEHMHGVTGVSLDLPTLPDDVWGDASLLVYYVRHDGEIVADSAKFKIGHCVKNKVRMEFSQREVSPGSDVDVELTAAPGSLCGYGVMDESIKLLAGKSAITMQELLDKVPTKTARRPLPMRGYGDEYCTKQLEEAEKEKERKKEELKKGPGKKPRGRRPRPNRRNRNKRPPRDVMYPRPWSVYSRYVDSSEAFKDHAVVVASDLTLETRPCVRERVYPDYVAYDLEIAGLPNHPGCGLLFRCEDSQCIDTRRLCDGRYDCRDGSDEVDCAVAFAPGMVDPGEVFDSPIVDTIEKSNSAAEPVVDTIRSFFPETWLWALEPVGTSGYSKIQEKAPDTITEWVGHAMCTHMEDGIGISSEVVLKTFQPFFVSFTMPYSVIRSETVYMPVSVFNYLSECLVVELELASSPNYRLEHGSAREQICVCGQEKKTHEFPITALTLGHINITVKAASVDNAQICDNVIMSKQIGVRDTVIRELLVEAEGKEKEEAFSHFVCPSGSSETVTASLQLPDDVVPDSATGRVTVMGDVMGPVLAGLDDLLRMPTGCGEQTMLIFAPNVYILQYLTHTSQLTADAEKKALGFLQSGYQREMTYRHSDGSYSAFGSNDDSGSTWLSAFVVKSFAQATAFIDIDPTEIDKTLSWFKANQMENGCYRSVGRIIHKSMKGGLENSENANAALTAYVFGALLESGLNPESYSATVSCLMAQPTTDLYTTALTAYALNMWDTEHSVAKDYMNRLEALKTERNGIVYWSTHAPTTVTNSCEPPGTSAEVETTAYALLAYMSSSHVPITQRLTKILPIVRWLTAQRNPNGGFRSTQDTVVGLQALAKFAEHITSETGQLTVNVGQTASPSEQFVFHVNEGNRLLLQRSVIPIPNNITFTYSGNGCAFLQASMKYNIQNVTAGSKPSIYIDIRPSRTDDNNCRLRNLKICTRYEGPDSQTNMALVDVKMVTGWVPVKETVNKLLQDTTLNLGRVDIEKKNVYLYINEMVRAQLYCFEFEVEEEVVVRNAKPGSVSVFDYYDQDADFFQKPFTLKSICGTKEEIPLGNVGVDVIVDVNNIEQKRQPAPFPVTGTPAVKSCAECFGETVEDEEVLKELLCSATHVYKGMVKKPGEVKVQKDLVLSGRSGKLNLQVKVSLEEACPCESLQKRRQYVWIVTKNSEIEKTGKKNKGALLLGEEDKVIPVAKKSKTLEKLVRKVKKSKRCRT